MVSKSPSSAVSYSAQTGDTDVFLRLETSGQVVTGYFDFAPEPEKWQRLGEVQKDLGATDLCLGVSNSDSAGIPADLLGRFDYVEIVRH